MPWLGNWGGEEMTNPINWPLLTVISASRHKSWRRGWSWLCIYTCVKYYSSLISDFKYSCILGWCWCEALRLEETAVKFGLVNKMTSNGPQQLSKKSSGSSYCSECSHAGGGGNGPFSSGSRCCNCSSNALTNTFHLINYSPDGRGSVVGGMSSGGTASSSLFTECCEYSSQLLRITLWDASSGPSPKFKGPVERSLWGL